MIYLVDYKNSIQIEDAKSSKTKISNMFEFPYLEFIVFRNTTSRIEAFI